MSDMKIKLTLAADDNASRTLIKAIEAIKKADANAGKSTGTAAQAAARAQAEAAKAARLRTTAAQAAGTLGIRTERQIQAEILRTQRAYQKLQSSGRASQNDLQRGAQATRQRMRELNQELGRVTASQRLMGAGRGMAATAAGVAAGIHLVSPPIKKAINYEKQLALTANVAYANEGIEGRKAGRSELNEGVKTAVRAGGGTRDEALSALNTMLASGALSKQTALNLLPLLQKASTGTGASTDDLAGVMITAIQQFGIAEKDIGMLLDKAVRSGEYGSFELENLARWLPQQLAAASKIGMKGMSDFEVILRSNQQAAITAGSKDAAGNNLVNLLTKVNSRDTVKRAEKIAYKSGGETKDVRKIKKNKEGIDLIKSLNESIAQGTNPLDAFIGIVDKLVASNKEYQKLDKELNSLGSGDSPEKQQAMQSMATLLEGSVVGELLADREALMALIAIRGQREFGKGAMEATSDEKAVGAVETSFQNVADTASVKTQMMGNEWEIAQTEGLQPFINKLGDVSKVLAEYAEKYPDLTKSITVATLALVALAGIAGSAALANVLVGGGRRPPIPAGGRPPAPAGGSGGGGPPLPNGSSNLWNRITRNLGPLVGAGVAGYQIYGNQERTDIDQKAKNVEHGRSVGWLAGATGGWELGAAMGNGSGNPYVKVGSAVLGSIIGGLGGTELGGSVVGAAQERYDEFMNPERSERGRKTAADKYNAAKALYESTLTPDQLQKYRKDKAEAEAYEKEQLSMGVPVIPFNDPVVTDPKWMQQANGRDQKRIDYENNRRAFWPTYENASQSQIAQASATAERLRTLQSPVIGGMPDMAQQSTQTINEMAVKINEMLGQVIAKEVVVNMVGMMDGKEMFRGVERVMITELNRGG